MIQSESMSAVAKSPIDVWFPYRVVNRAAKARFFCFPYSGGSASAFRRWNDSLPPSVEVCAAQLPGRESRIGDQPFSNLDKLVDALIDVIHPLLDLPFAFYGHSMGAWISFELARKLRDQHDLHPLHLFVGAVVPPDVPDKRELHKLGLDDVIECLRKTGDTEPVLLNNRELMEFMLPLIQADSAITELHEFTPGKPLQCPITAFAGKDDPLYTPAQAFDWQRHTQGALRTEVLEGRHLFMNTAAPHLLRLISEDISTWSL